MPNKATLGSWLQELALTNKMGFFLIVHNYFFTDYDFNGPHHILSVYLHMLIEKEEDLVRQNFSLIKFLYTTVWGAGKPETSLKLGTE